MAPCVVPDVQPAGSQSVFLLTCSGVGLPAPTTLQHAQSMESREHATLNSGHRSKATYDIGLCVIVTQRVGRVSTGPGLLRRLCLKPLTQLCVSIA